MRDLPRHVRISRRVGFRLQRSRNSQSPSNPDVIFHISFRGAPLDRPARRAHPTHDLSEWPRTRGHVSPVLPGLMGLFALKQAPLALITPLEASKSCMSKTARVSTSVR